MRGPQTNKAQSVEAIEALGSNEACVPEIRLKKRVGASRVNSNTGSFACLLARTDGGVVQLLI